VELHGREQNAAFADGTVDALYANTPYLEKALLEQDGVVLVDQAGGEVKELATRQIHALVVSRSLLETRRAVVVRMVRAFAKAQQIIHRAPDRAAKALGRNFPEKNATHLQAILRLYKAAVPKTPEVSVDGLNSALTFFPEGKPVPDFTGRDLRPY